MPRFLEARRGLASRSEDGAREQGKELGLAFITVCGGIGVKVPHTAGACMLDLLAGTEGGSTWAFLPARPDVEGWGRGPGEGASCGQPGARLSHSAKSCF